MTLTATLPQTTSHPHSLPDGAWQSVVIEVKNGKLDLLHNSFYATLVRFFTRKGYHQDAQDLAITVLMDTARSIQRGEIEEPGRLQGYVYRVSARRLAETIERSVRARGRECTVTTDLPSHTLSPEQLAIEHEETQIFRQVMGSLSRKERDILIRFYIQGESKEEICKQLGLTEDQFRNLKFRAKGRMTTLMRSRLTRKCRNQGGDRLHAA